MRMMCGAVLAVAAAVLGGCTTTLSTTPDRSTTADRGDAIFGVPYALPMARFDVTFTRAVSKCPTERTVVLGGQTLTMLDGDLALSRKAEAVSGYGPGERYTVDYRGLQKPFKTSGFTFAVNSNGTLKSINVSADDQTGEVAKNVVAIGLKVTTLSTNPAAAAVAGALQAAGTSADTAQTQAAQTVGLAKAAADVTRLTVVANLKAARSSELIALNEAMTRQDAAKATVEKLTESKTSASGKLSVSRKFVWPADFKAQAGPVDLAPGEQGALLKLLTLNDARLLTVANLVAWRDRLPGATTKALRKDKAFAAFLDTIPKTTPAAQQSAECLGPSASPLGCLKGSLDAWMLFQLVDTGLAPCSAGKPEDDCGRNDASIQETEAKPVTTDEQASPPPVGLYGRHGRDQVADSGVFVRQPARAVFWICPGPLPEKYDPPPQPCTDVKELYKSDPVSAPQFGQLRFLPFRNKAFEGNELALSLREDGSIEAFSYKRTKAPGSGAVASVADAVTQYEAFKDAQTKKAKDDLVAARAAQIADLQYQIDLLAKQKALLAAQASTSDADAVKDETTRIEAETALLSAKLAQLKAEAALSDAKMT